MPTFGIIHRSFSYDRQALEEVTIRLVTLLPGAKDDKICCSLQNVKFSASVYTSYEALSYAWGDPDKLGLTIKLNGRRFGVRENLWWALFHLRHLAEPRVLWIDAICINQKDVLERNAQVKLMKAIYSRAARVLVWLGRADKESTTSIAFFKRLSLRPEEKNEGITDLFQSDPEFPLDEALKQFLHKRKYWSRLWVVQEILLGSNIFLHCGDDHLSWETLSSELKRVRNYFDTRRQNSNFESVPHLHYEALRATIDNGSAARLDKLRVKTPSPWLAWGSLRDLLGTVQLTDCSDSRDKIYGLLGLGIAMPGFPVDYRKTIFQVYTDALSLINRDLALPHGYDQPPDFRQTSQILHGHLLNMPRFSQILQKLLGGPFPNTDSITPSLTIRGFVAGEILYANDPKSEIRDLRWSYHRAGVEAATSRNDQSPQARHLLGSLYFRHAQYTPQWLPRELLSSAPSFERFNPVHICTPWTPHYFEVVTRSSEAQKICKPPPILILSNSVTHNNPQKISKQPPLAFVTSGKVSRIGVATGSEKVGVIKGPILGFAPPGAKPGDKIIQFMDTDVSMVIRGSDDSGYSFIGRAFIPLYADGSFSHRHYMESRTRDNVPFDGSAPSSACYESASVENKTEFVAIRLDVETLQFLTCEGKYEDLWKE